MRSYNTTGIVIGRTNFGEADRVVRFLTPDYGKLSAVAKGVRKITSRSGGHLELFGEVGLMLATGRGSLDVITSARLRWYPHQLAGAFDRLPLAFAFATAVDRLVEPGHPQPKLYSVLLVALHALDEGATGPLPELWFKLRLLELLGYRPHLDTCLICGRHDADAAYTFDAVRGGITCASDSSAIAQPMTMAEIKLWRLLSDLPYGTISKINGASTLAGTTLGACDAFYEHHLGRAFRPSITGE